MIEYSTCDQICTLRLNNPPQNVIALDLLEALVKGTGRANADPDVRAMIVTGRVDHFSAGVDVNILHDEILMTMLREEGRKLLAGKVGFASQSGALMMALAGVSRANGT